MVRFTRLPSENQFSGGIPSSLGNLEKLAALFLDNNQLSGSIQASLGNLVNLTGLELYNNHLSDSIPSSLGNLVNLQYFDLSSNQLSGSIPSSLGNLGNFANLDYLNLSYNQLSGSIPSELGKIVNFWSGLFLNDNQLTGSIPSELGNFVHLGNLNLSNNKLSGSIPSSLGNLVNLTNLNLGNNQLSGTIPSSLNNLNLRSLDLSSNQLSGSIPSSLGNLVNLTDLELYNNHLSGSIPLELGNLVNLYWLNLSVNSLSGNIPSELGNLDPDGYNYLDLDLSDNHFTFAGMELIAQKFPFATYSPQANISLHQKDDTLSVSAGGTLSKNTYKWFMVGQTGNTTIKRDSFFLPSQNGKYFAAVTNSVVTKLTLHTDTIDYSTLPVTIINIRAQQQNNIIRVDWTSLTEINVAKYEIQRSPNASNFTTVGTLPATSHGSERKDYAFNDLQPLQGNNFYHIKALDKDGKITYSNTVLVNMRNDKTITVVYPIPTKDILHVETNGNTSFSLLNQSGKTLLTKNINRVGSINVANLAAGLYFLKNNSTSTVQKVIISK